MGITDAGGRQAALGGSCQSSADGRQSQHDAASNKKKPGRQSTSIIHCYDEHLHLNEGEGVRDREKKRERAREIKVDMLFYVMQRTQM